MLVEDLDILEKRKKEEDYKNRDDEDPHNATNYPDDKRPVSKGGSKISPADDKIAIEEEDENLKTDIDPPGFLKRLGVERYIRFADFAKYLSLFN